MSIAHRAHAIKVTAKREIRSTLYGVGLYVTLTLIFLSSAYFFVNSSIRSALDAGILALHNPITEPFFFSVGMAATYLGLCSALSVSRDRDQGTLEVLFYGPVDAISYLLSKFVHQILAFIVVLLFALVNFYLVSRLTNLGFTADFLGFLVLSLFLTSCMVSFGIFLSVSTRRTMASIIVFLGLVFFFLAFSVAHSVVMSLPGQSMTPLLVYVRVILDNMNDVMQWISPLSYFSRGMTAVFMRDYAQYAVSLLSSVVYSAVLLTISVYIFKRKGVRR